MAGDHPDIPFLEALKTSGAPMYTRGRPDGPPLWIVVHDMEYPERADAAEWTANYFHTGAGGRSVSSHYCADNNSIVQCVRLADSAWTVGNRQGNNRGINWEFAGFANQTRDQWLDDYSRSMLARGAEVMKRDSAKYKIPLRQLSDADVRAMKPGVTSHWQLGRVFGGTDHTDPGPNFPWDHLMALLTEDDMTPEEHEWLYNASSVIGNMAMGKDSAPTSTNGKPTTLDLRPFYTRVATEVAAKGIVDPEALAAKLAPLLPKPLTKEETVEASFEGAQRAEKE